MAKKNIVCRICGETLNNDNFYTRALGVSYDCIECEQKRFSKLENEMGAHLALYAMCMSTDTPFFPLLLPPPHELAQVNEKWKFYNDQLREKGFYEKNEKILNFFDGGTNILKLFGRNLSDKETAAYIASEQERLATTAGTDEQRRRWGVEDKYTQSDYDELDRMYESRRNTLRGVTITDQMEYTLQEAAKWQLVADKMRRRNNVSGATNALKTVDMLLKSECLRKTDEKPVEALRIDALVTALEDAGLMEDGEFLTYDETVEALRDNLIKSHKYDYSLDVADQVILDIINSMRANADMAALVELPEEYAAEDAYGEFLEEETEREKAAKRYAGLTKVSIAKTGENNANG